MFNSGNSHVKAEKQYYDEAKGFLASKVYSQALFSIEKAISVSQKEHVNLFHLRGLVLLKAEKLKRALADSKKCMELDPAFPGGYYLAGQVYAANRNFEKAKNFYERGLSVSLETKSAAKWQKEYQIQMALLPNEFHAVSPVAKKRKLEAIDFVNKLPLDIVLLITEFLSFKDLLLMTQVCRSWHKYFTNCGHFWKSQTFVGTKVETKSVVSAINRSRGTLRQFTLARCSKVKDLALKTIYTTKCVNLQRLSLNARSISTEALMICLKKLHYVQEVEKRGLGGLTHLELTESKIDDKDLATILKISPHLKKLSLNACHAITGSAFAMAAAENTVCKLEWIVFLEANGLDELDAIKNLAALTKDTLETFDIGATHFHVADGFQHLTQFSNLKHFAVSGQMTPLGGADPVSYLAELPNLVTLLCSRRSTSAPGLLNLFSKRHQLTALDLSATDTPDVVLLAIAANLPGLKLLRLSNVWKMTTNAARQIIRSCALLETLDISANPMAIDDGITDDISKNLFHLKQLHLDGNKNMYGKGLLEIVQRNQATLKLLSLNDCQNVRNTLADKLQLECHAIRCVFRCRFTQK